MQLNTQGLIDALKSDDSAMRRRAAAALRALDATDSVPHLKDALDKEHDPNTRQVILSALEILDQGHVSAPPEPDTTRADDVKKVGPTLAERREARFQDLLNELDSDNDAIAIKAAYRLGHNKDKRAVEKLVLIFNDESRSNKVRLAIAEALITLDSAPVEVALLSALRSPKWRVRRNGAAILGQMRAEWAIEPLQRALKDDHEVVQRTALAALRHIGTPDALQAINDVSPQFNDSDINGAPTQLNRRTQIKRPDKRGNLPDVDTSILSSQKREKLSDNNKVHWPKKTQSPLPPTKPLTPPEDLPPEDSSPEDSASNDDD